SEPPHRHPLHRAPADRRGDRGGPRGDRSPGGTVTSLRLPPLPRVELPELPEKAARAWEERTSRARALSRGAGAGSHFHDLVVEAKRILELQDLATLRDRR